MLRKKKKKSPETNKQTKFYDHCSIDLASDFALSTDSECRNSSRNSRVRATPHHYEAPYMILMHNQVLSSPTELKQYGSYKT